MSVIEASMAIQQSKKQSDLEKRLKILRQQFYGKNSEKLIKTQNTSKSDSQTFRYSDTPIKSGPPSLSESFRTDISYLHQDLLKILTFSTVAVGAQITLYFLINNHLVNLKLF